MSSKPMKDYIDCVLLNVGKHTFLIPARVLCEVVSLNISQFTSQLGFYIGTQRWGDCSLPIFSMDSAVNVKDLLHPKIAIINQLPYYGLLFEKNPQQLRLTHKAITWSDENKKIVKLMKSKEVYQEAIIPDLDAIADAVKNLDLS